MDKWKELRFWYADKVSRGSLYAYKSDVILPVLDEFGITKFLFLDQNKYLPLRVYCSESALDELFTRFDGDLPSMFTHLSEEAWSPTSDSEDRIVSAKRILSGDDVLFEDVGWKILGKGEHGQWLMDVEDLDKQVEAFSTFMTDVLGVFTKQYIESMPYMVEDRWMLSVFVHLMLDSISVWQDAENEVREFPYV